MKKLFLIIIACCAVLAGLAQNPVQWSFGVKKTSSNSYLIVMVAKIQSGWSIYSQDTPEGGPVPTSFGFGVNPLVQFDGKVKEDGKKLKKFEELFEVEVLYYKDRVEFIQPVTIKRKVKTKVSGWVEFMACNDRECLPPKKQTFSLSLD